MSISRWIVVVPVLAGLAVTGSAVARMLPAQTVRDTVYQTCQHNGVHFNKQGHANCGLHEGWSHHPPTEPGDGGGAGHPPKHGGQAGHGKGQGHGHGHDKGDGHHHGSTTRAGSSGHGQGGGTTTTHGGGHGHATTHGGGHGHAGEQGHSHKKS